MNKKIMIVAAVVTILMLGTVIISNVTQAQNKATIVFNGQYTSKIFQTKAVPPPPIRQPAEFEPMQGVLISYEFGISINIIKEMAEDVELVTIVASVSEKNTVLSLYQSNGINLSHCSFLIAPTNSWWTRDYGPWFIFNGNDEQGVVDFTYNRPRPYDDAINGAYATNQSLPLYFMSLTTAGGNYMTDGQGIAVSTTLVYEENPGYTPEEISQLVSDYLGIHTYYVYPDVNGEYIEHIDCWGKYLAPDVILIREVPQSHSQYDEIETAVDYFESQTSCYGTPYHVVRVYTPNNEPYTNSLILNNKVLVPITGSQWDDDAIASYQAAMPGYEVLGFTGSWYSTDAIHCRIMGITDRYMLYIEHTPLSGNQTTHAGYDIEAKIFPYSGENIVAASTGVYWKVEGQEWNFVQMEPLGNNYYDAIIPPQQNGTRVYYYIHAEDESGRSENHPYIGVPDAYSFIGYTVNAPPEKPSRPSGSTSGEAGVTYLYTTITTDPDGDQVYYKWDWGDGTTSDWLGPYDSGEEVSASHSWSEGSYSIKVKAEDSYAAESDWSDPLSVTMPLNQQSVNYMALQILKMFRLYKI